jgi:ribosomal protein S3
LEENLHQFVLAIRGAGGVKIVLGGRINGADIARVEKFHMWSKRMMHLIWVQVLSWIQNI